MSTIHSRVSPLQLPCEKVLNVIDGRVTASDPTTSSTPASGVPVFASPRVVVVSLVCQPPQYCRCPLVLLFCQASGSGLADVPPHHARVKQLEVQLVLARKECTDAAAAFDAFAQTDGALGNIAGDP